MREKEKNQRKHGCWSPAPKAGGLQTLSKVEKKFLITCFGHKEKSGEDKKGPTRGVHKNSPVED